MECARSNAGVELTEESQCPDCHRCRVLNEESAIIPRSRISSEAQVDDDSILVIPLPLTALIEGASESTSFISNCST